MLFRFGFNQNMGLCKAVSKRDAYSYMLRELGHNSEPISITLATKEDEGWFQMMSGGGFIYETQQHYSRERRKRAHSRRN